MLVNPSSTRPLFGLIWPKDGFASIAYAAMAGGQVSSTGMSPHGASAAGTPPRPFLAKQETRPPPSFASLRA